MKDKYQPTGEEQQAAEDSLTDEQKNLSEAREEGFELGKQAREFLTGEELQRQLALKYNPDVLLYEIKDLARKFDRIPQVGGNIYRALLKGGCETLYDVTVYISGKQHSPGLAERGQGALEDFLNEFGLATPVSLPKEVVDWYHKKR